MLHSTHRLLLVAFLGALALFATTVTPALFATLPPGSAARVVGRVLPVLDWAGGARRGEPLRGHSGDRAHPAGDR